MKIVSIQESKAQRCLPWDFGALTDLPNLPDRQMMEDMVGLIINTKMPGGLVGVALAAPQVGIFRRFFVIACPGEKVRWVFNPEMVPLSVRKTEDRVEGCLTVPDEKFLVERFCSVHLTAQDETGKRFEWDACKGLLARIIQHEMGHLGGTCIKDFAIPVTVHKAAGAL